MSGPARSGTSLWSQIANQVCSGVARREAIDLIVMASHGRHGIARLLHGSVAGQVLHHAEMPVLVVAGAAPALETSPPEESITPDVAAGEPVSHGRHGSEDTAG